ncbi:MAG: HEAT repeat domain-containing protein [Armatimonadota bacterium]
MCISRNVIVIIIIVGIWIMTTGAAVAYPFTFLNAKVELEKADAVYVVEIISIDTKTTPADMERSSSLPNRDVTVRILGNIKGPDIDSIHIITPQKSSALESPPYVNFKVGEICLLFLKGRSSPYALMGPYFPTLLDVVKPDAAVLKYSADNAYDRLTKCLMWTVNNGEGESRLHAIRQLGLMGDHRAASLLRQFAKSDEVALRILSFEARIHVGDPPDVNDMIAVLDMTLESIYENQSKNHQLGYNGEYLQRMLLDAVWQSIIPEEKFGNNLPVSKVEGFDYIKFFKKALNTKAVRTIRDAQSRLAGSLGALKDPASTHILIRLLDADDAQVRHMATWALNEIHGGLDTAGDVDAFINNETKYQTHWKAFWKKYGQVKE